MTDLLYSYQQAESARESRGHPARGRTQRRPATSEACEHAARGTKEENGHSTLPQVHRSGLQGTRDSGCWRGCQKGGFFWSGLYSLGVFFVFLLLFFFGLSMPKEGGLFSFTSCWVFFFFVFCTVFTGFSSSSFALLPGTFPYKRSL